MPQRLSSIDFQENPLTSIDNDAFLDSADTLTELYFSMALFKELPDAFLSLNNLTHLVISDTQITSWSDDIMRHIGGSLQSLILRNVGFTSWPTWIQYLPHLGTIELSTASMSVPDSAFDLQVNTLFSLNLAHGILQEIPSAVSKLKHLQTLILNNNNISRVTAFLNSTVLSTLSMDTNKISDAGQLSRALRSVSGSLKYLQLTENLLTDLPDLSAMTLLETLYLSSNAISHTGIPRIPPSLKYLGLEQNNIQSLDSFTGNGFHYIVFMIQHNSIREIQGPNIPTSVETLDISVNLLSELTDDSFPSNCNIQTLTLDSNPITKVSPKAFASLTKLTYLSFSYTKITRLPLSLIYLTNAQSIQLTGNDYLVCTCAEKDVRSLSRLHHVDIFGQCGVTTIDNFFNVMSDQCPD